MIKIFTFAFILSFLFCNDVMSLSTGARSAVIVSASHSYSTNNQLKTTAGIDKLIGKEIQGCEIISAFYDGYNSVIYGLCVKDDGFYKFKTYPNVLPYECEGFSCKNVSIEKDLIKLLKDKKDE